MKQVTMRITFTGGETGVHGERLRQAGWVSATPGEWRRRFGDETIADAEARRMIHSLQDAGSCTVSAERSTLRITES